MDVVVVVRKMQTRLSALGQKRTCAVQKAMSALPPIADMCSANTDVRFVPIADIAHFIRSPRRRVRAAASGQSRPSALAVLRLMTNSYLVGAVPADRPASRLCSWTEQEIAQPAAMVAPWRESAGDWTDVCYSGLGNIEHRAGKVCLSLGSITTLVTAIGSWGACQGSRVRGVCVMALLICSRRECGSVF